MLSRAVGSGEREGPLQCQPRRSACRPGCARYTWSWGEHSARRRVVSDLVGLPCLSPCLVLPLWSGAGSPRRPIGAAVVIVVDSQQQQLGRANRVRNPAHLDLGRPLDGLLKGAHVGAGSGAASRRFFRLAGLRDNRQVVGGG